jgi:hypothetical protein
LPKIQQQAPRNTVKLTVYGGEVNNATVAGNEYCFIYMQNGTWSLNQPYFAVATPSTYLSGAFILNSYAATAGSHYAINLYDQPINVLVSDVESDYLVLELTPS